MGERAGRSHISEPPDPTVSRDLVAEPRRGQRARSSLTYDSQEGGASRDQASLEGHPPAPAGLDRVQTLALEVAPPPSRPGDQCTGGETALSAGPAVVGFVGPARRQ